MKIITDISEIENEKIGLTIGNFDGVHLGHQNILGHIKKDCQDNQMKLLVVSFVPHPLVTLLNKKNFLINSYEERQSLLEKENVDYLIEINFSRDFSTLSPESFLKKFISTIKGLTKVYLGHDFAFGENKSGGENIVKSFFEKTKVVVETQDQWKLSQSVVSSTAVRELISKGEICRCNELLGRLFSLSGRVIKGAQRGRKIGFPTANVEIGEEYIKPCMGVYSTNTIIDNRKYKSLTNIGVNPTFVEEGQSSVETHIIDFDEDIYGENIKVEFIEKIRNEIKFESVNDLIKQIELDKALRLKK